MRLPNSLRPTSTIGFRLSEFRIVSVPKAVAVFQQWSGPPVADNYGGKAALDYAGEPLFAELVILRQFQSAGWRECGWTHIDDARALASRKIYHSRECSVFCSTGSQLARVVLMAALMCLHGGITPSPLSRPNAADNSSPKTPPTNRRRNCWSESRLQNPLTDHLTTCA